MPVTAIRVKALGMTKKIILLAALLITAPALASVITISNSGASARCADKDGIEERLARRMLCAVDEYKTAFANSSIGMLVKSMTGGASHEITISSNAELQKILENPKGGMVIKLMAGTYPELIIDRVRAPGKVIIASANPAQPATVSHMVIRGSTGFAVRDVNLFAGQVDQVFPFLVTNSENIELSGLIVKGKRASGKPTREAAALMIRNSGNVTVTRSDFSESRHGLSFLKVTNMTITHNQFHDLQTDGVRGGGVDTILIANNMFTDFYPAPKDHPDGIQLWSTHQTEPGRNITIRDNLVIRGKGGPTQGIFIRDTFRKLPFENVVITGNLIMGARFNGIAISGVVGARIEDNDVIAYPDQKSWIRADGATDVEISNNRSTAYASRTPAGVKFKDNKTLRPAKKDRKERILEWVQRKDSPPQPENRLFHRILSEAGD